jgi:DeoR/GlpR family transcriptional regulator of sugar metabolism
MTLREAILDYLQVCEIATSKELSEIFVVSGAKVLKEMEHLHAKGEITIKGKMAQLPTTRLVAE